MKLPFLRKFSLKVKLPGKKFNYDDLIFYCSLGITLFLVVILIADVLFFLVNYNTNLQSAQSILTKEVTSKDFSSINDQIQKRLQETDAILGIPYSTSTSSQ